MDISPKDREIIQQANEARARERCKRHTCIKSGGIGFIAGVTFMAIVILVIKYLF